MGKNRNRNRNRKGTRDKDVEVKTCTVTVKYTSPPPDTLVVDDKMALLITDHYHGNVEFCRYDRTVIEMYIETQNYRYRENHTYEEYEEHKKEFEKYLKNRYGDDCMNDTFHTFSGVSVEWVPVGSCFNILRCADNGEYIKFIDHTHWIKAG